MVDETRFKAEGKTDVGLKREHNEDNILVADDMGLFAVADGMGGHAAGEVASEAAIESLREFVHQVREDENITWPFGTRDDLTIHENLLYSGISLANRKVCSLAEENAAFGGMGTTIAVLYLAEGKAHVSHVGDSRVYLYRDGELSGLTQDHSWVNEQVQRSIITEEEARTHRWRNVITRALGNRDEVEIDIAQVEVRSGDLFLLCSDGLTSMIDDQAIEGALAGDNGELSKTCEKLVALANEAGGLDNISVVIIRIET